MSENVIDLSEARGRLPAPLPPVERGAEPTLLDQFFDILNTQVPADASPELVDSVKSFQLQGMSVALEYLVGQFGGEQHPVVVDLRGQIVAKQTELFRKAEIAARAAEASDE